MTRREPEWDDAQRAWMLALAHYEAGLCHRCGHHLADTTDPDTEPDNRDASRMWVVEQPPVECYSCRVLVQAERWWGEKIKDTKQPPEAYIHSSQLVTRPRRRKKPTGTG